MDPETTIRATPSSRGPRAGTPRCGAAVRLEGLIGCTLVLLLLSSMAAVSAQAWDRDRKDGRRQIRVLGRAETSGEPDRAYLDVSVVTRAESAAKAAAQNAKDTRSVVEGLRRAFPDSATISTSGYTLMAEYDYDKREGRRVPAGYSARNSVHVELSDVAAAGALIDAAIEAGANDVRGVRFGIADPSALEQKALVAAVADARAKAQALAESLDSKLGKVLRVEEAGTAPTPTPMLRMARAESDTTTIEPGDVFFEAHVSLWMELVEK